MSEIYDAKDPQFRQGFIDIDEMRTRKLEDGRELPYRYMHGGFEGNGCEVFILLSGKRSV